MKKISLQYGALLTVLVLGLLSSCPDMLNRPDPAPAPGEGLVQVSLVTAEEGAVSPTARTAMPRAAELYYNLVFTKGAMTVNKTLDQAASISVGLQEGTWSLAVTGFSDSLRTAPAAFTGSKSPIVVTAGASSSVTVDLTGNTDSGTGSIAYEIKFPASTDMGSLILNTYSDGSPYGSSINLLGTTGGNSFSTADGVTTATGTIISVPAGYYQALVKLSSTTANRYAGYTTLVHVYKNAATGITKVFDAGHFVEKPMVDALDLTGLVVAPVKGAPPVATAIDAAQYTGTIAWMESDGSTPFSGTFAVAAVYKAIVTLTVNPDFSFIGVGADAFSYTGATATNAAYTSGDIIITITFLPVVDPGLRYVKQGGTGNGASWYYASSDLQKMIDQARADILVHNVQAIVRVAAGTYKPLYKPDGTIPSAGEERDRTFVLRQGVEIRGGYPADATDATTDANRNWATNQTILSGDIDNNDTTSIVGDNAYHVVLGIDIPNDGRTILDGLTIKGGNANGTSMTSPWMNHGGGIYNASSSPVLTNVTIAGNHAAGLGGGIYNESSSPVLTNVTIAGNSAPDGGGMYNDSSSPVLTNVTIAGNTAGIYNADSSTPKIRNSIIWGNSGGIDNDTEDPSAPEVYHSIVQGGWTGLGSDNMNINPEFAGPEDYHLTVNSPAINMGDKDYYNSGQTPELSAITTDMDGANRFAGTYVDLGAYEEQTGNTPDAFRYVREGATGGGGSWTDASGDLQAMIDQTGRAKQRGAAQAIVGVAAGTYKPLYAPSTTGVSLPDAALAANNLTARDKTFFLRPGVEIRGGYIAAGEDITEAARKARFNAAGEPKDEAHRAILSGDIDGTADGGNVRDGFTGMAGNAYHVVLGVDIPGDGKTILDGLTIKGGYADDYPNGSESITVNIGGNDRSVLRSGGGGMRNVYSSPVLTNMTITENSSSMGGGMYNHYASSSPVLTNVTIVGNSASTGGGMVNWASASPVLTNVTIAGNSAGTNGGGMANQVGASPVLTNVTIAGNSASTAGGGMYNTLSASPVLTNVTIVGNSAGTNGGGIHNSLGDSPQMRNSIVWGNSSGIYTSSTTQEVYYSIVQGGWTEAGNNNMNIDPVFESPQDYSTAPTGVGDYHLRATSQAINAGDDSYYPDTWAKWQAIETLIGKTILTEAVYDAHVKPALGIDAGGADRFVPDGSIDMGAYEEQTGLAPAVTTLTITDQGAGAFSQETFTIDRNGSPGAQTQTVTADGLGINHRWFVDGVQKGTGNSITIDAVDYSKGRHSLSLWVERYGQPWSKTINFTVTD